MTNKYILVSDHLTERDRSKGLAYKAVATNYRVFYSTEQEAMVAGRQYLNSSNANGQSNHQGVHVCKVVRNVTIT